MKNIKDYDLEDLKKELVEIGEKPFRAEQIFKWLYQEKVKDFDTFAELFGVNSNFKKTRIKGWNNQIPI